MCSLLESLRVRKRELDSEVENVKALLVRLNTAPAEMRRHHGLVFESSKIMKRAALRFEHYLDANNGLPRMLEDMHVATSELREHMRSLVTLRNTNQPVADSVLRPISSAAMCACKSFLVNLHEVRDAMRTILEEGPRVCGRLKFRAKQVRASANAILQNMSAEEAEANVRHQFEHLAQYD